MRNTFKTIVLTIASLCIAGQVFAGSMSIKIEQPKSPTNLTSLNVNFVVLDYASNGNITAKCYKQGPSDGGFSQFGSDIAITPGGNTSNCTADSSVLTSDGTYQFYVTAANSGETVTSNTVSVIRNTSGPDTPTSYSKEDFESCKYKIKFHTADDGKTAKVELYRSPNTTFDVNAGSLVETKTIGPNADGEFVNEKPDCSKTYFYAIRAFDSTGNGSGIRGDSETHTITTTILPTTTTGTAGAIPAGTGGNILGAETLKGATGPSGAILGEQASPSPTQQPYTPPKPNLFRRSTMLTVGAIAVILLGIWLAKRKKSE